MTATETIPTTTRRRPRCPGCGPGCSARPAKAQATLHGVRITAASVSAARTLLSRMDAPPVAATASSKTGATATPQRPARRPRATESAVDAEALIRGVVAKLQTQGSAETERLRDAMRKAIQTLTVALAS